MDFDRVGKMARLLKLRGEGPIDELYVSLAIAQFIPRRILSNRTNLGFFLSRDVVAKNTYGKFFCRKRTTDLSEVSESFESEVIRVFRPKAGDVVVDCGANIGKYTIMAANIAKTVVAIEPSLGNFKVLERNIDLNGCKNVVALRCAVWDRNTKIRLYNPPVDNDLSAYSAKSRTGTGYETVDARRLDGIMKDLKVKTIDWLKVDVEGAEWEVLRGVDIRKVRHLIMEFNPETKDMVFGLLKKNGFSTELLSGKYLFARRK
jgi:FkbM family methyltransferase